MIYYARPPRLTLERAIVILSLLHYPLCWKFSWSCTVQVYLSCNRFRLCPLSAFRTSRHSHHNRIDKMTNLHSCLPFPYLCRNFAMAAAMFMNSNSLPIALLQSLVVTVPGLQWGDDDNPDAMVGRALTYLVMCSTLGMVVSSFTPCLHAAFCTHARLLCPSGVPCRRYPVAAPI